MPLGTPIIQTIVPLHGLPGRTINLSGHNLDGEIVVEFINGPESGIFANGTSLSSTSMSFQTPTGSVGRYELKITVDGVDATSTLAFYIAANGMDGLTICPPINDAECYGDAGLNSLPEGPAWTRSVLTNTYKLFCSFGESLKRLEDLVCEFMRETNPYLTQKLIPEWEEELGLPEDCVLNPPTNDENRRIEIIRKVNSFGGNNKQYFIDLAASFGVKIRIEESYSQAQPFLVGQSVVGDALTQGPWLFTWIVTIEELEIQDFKVGINTVGDPLRWWGNEEIECIFNKLKPSHTIVTFRYEMMNEFYLLGGDGAALLGGDGEQLIGN